MVSSIVSTRQQTISVPEVGTFDLADYQVDSERWNEVRLYKTNEENLKSISEVLGFSARFDAVDIRFACLDVFDSEARATLEMSRNARPHTLAVRYQADRWYNIESTHAPVPTDKTASNYSKADYEAANLDAETLERFASLIELEPSTRKSSLVRIDFKSRTIAVLSNHADGTRMVRQPFAEYSLINGTVSHMETIRSETFESIDMSVAIEQNEDSLARPDAAGSITSTSVTPAAVTTVDVTATPVETPSDTEGAPSPTSGNPSATPESDFIPTSATPSTSPQSDVIPTSVAPSTVPQSAVDRTSARPPTVPQSANTRTNATPSAVTTPRSTTTQSSLTPPVTPKYETYSRSEVDRLIKIEAERITNSVWTKVNTQDKTTKDSVKNQEFAIKQALDSASKKLSQAQSTLESSAAQLREENKKELENLRKTLLNEVNQFKKELVKEVSPKVERSEKKMDQKQSKVAATAPQEEKKSGINMNLIYAVIAFVVIGNSLLIWSAFDRLNKLESKQAEIPAKLNIEEVPLPDMIGDQLKKETSQAQPTPESTTAPTTTPQLTAPLSIPQTATPKTAPQATAPQASTPQPTAPQTIKP